MKTVDIQEAAAILLAGGVGVLPTDTVYGLAARASDPKAVARLYALKRREHKPGTVIAASIEQVSNMGVPEHMLKHVSRYWPDSLSVVLPLPSAWDYLMQGLADLPVRVPKDKGIRAFLEKTGPLVTSSANQPGESTANNISEAYRYFGDSVDFYVDGGDLRGRTSSTIVRPRSNGSLEVLRQGAIQIIQT